jgi:zinc protease
VPLGLFPSGDVERLDFANGVRALVWPTENEPGRATVRVRFGAGLQGFTDDEAAYIQLGQAALISSGIGPLGQNELDRLATGRKLGLSFRIEDGTFVFEGATRASDVADQIYLFAAKLGTPRWDPLPVERAKATLLLAYDTYTGDPNGMINRDLDWLLRDRDPRFATPTPEQVRATTPEGFKQVWSRLLAQGPIEVDVFGDVDRETVVTALSNTFGALPPARARAGRLACPAHELPGADRDAGGAQPQRRSRPGRGGDRLAGRRGFGRPAAKPQARPARADLLEPPARRDAREGRGQLLALRRLELAARYPQRRQHPCLGPTATRASPRVFDAAEKIAADLAATWSDRRRDRSGDRADAATAQPGPDRARLLAAAARRAPRSIPTGWRTCGR